MPVAAAPSIRKMARRLGIDLTRVRGSERGGRIVLEDVRAYIQRLLQRRRRSPKPAAGGAAVRQAGGGADGFLQVGRGFTEKPLSSAAQGHCPPDVGELDARPARDAVRRGGHHDLAGIAKKYARGLREEGARLTLTRSCSKRSWLRFKKHPIFNASLDEAAEEIVFKEYYHIGIAVDTEAGLIVPVIRDVDKKSLLELSKELEELAAKARERKVTADELKGGTFTISNQGGIGGAHFTPIVNRPEVAILGLGRGALKPVVRDGTIEPRADAAAGALV